MSDTVSEELKEHYSESCVGKPVVEYEDADGKHLHCATCGFWGVSK